MNVRAVPSAADVVVIGAGFGGIASALRLAELGARVVLCEALAYPGGCASTFTRGGYRFEAGATLHSGLGEGQLFRRWIDRHGLDVVVDWLDPVVELRTPSFQLPITARREELVTKFTHMPGAPRDRVHRFFDYQREVADVLWNLMEQPELLPPLGSGAWWRHARRLPRYASLLPLVGKSLGSVLRRYDLWDFTPLRLYLTGLCQITVQCAPEEAEALFALGAMDYFFRGTGHVRGGIGNLAWALTEAIESAGGTVVLANNVTKLSRSRGVWRVTTRLGVIEAPAVVANVLPQSLRRLADAEPTRSTDALAREVERGWGACMLYRVVRSPGGAPSGPHHLELVGDPARAFTEGNHVFCSFSGELDGDRAPEGYRTVTVSTHIPASKLMEMSLDEQRTFVSRVHDEMRRTLRLAAPEWEVDVLEELTASPRTFQRFTQRFVGYVGGIPRRVGLRNYRGLGPRAVASGLYLVGDTVFPGQSTLATAIGGYKVAELVSKRAA